MKKKRIEYQKFLRGKLEQERYREIFGLTDNIELRGEEDVVLQREFRIDFSLQKKDETIPIPGIFNYFKKYNLLEFKSLHDRLNIVLLTKYLGQLFCKKQPTPQKKRLTGGYMPKERMRKKEKGTIFLTMRSP